MISRTLSATRRRSLELYWTVTRALGLERLHGQEGEYLRRLAFGIPLFPFALVFGFARLRFIVPQRLVIEHVGHLAMDFDALFKEMILRGDQSKLVLVLPCEPANPALFSLWETKLTVVRSRAWQTLFRFVAACYPSLDVPIHEYCLSLTKASRCHLVEARWGSRPPIATLREEWETRGTDTLRALGLPDGAWFVCVHSRESGHLPQHEWAASFRNADIMSYVPAMKLITDRGGWCVRVGDPTMKPLPAIDGVIDYALSSAKSDWMDLFLCAKCHFFLGNTSGLFGVAGIFGRPSALANITPFSSLYSQFPKDISIPKLLRSEQGSVIPFADIFGSKVSEYRVAPQFAADRLHHIDNTPDEIAELAAEMLDRLESGSGIQADDPLQQTVRRMLRSNHYCWHSKAQIGLSFLKRHKDLLPQAKN